MPRKPKPDTTIKEIMIVEDPHAIRLLFTPKYANIVAMISEKELSVSDVARELGANSGSIYYHMKELEKYGLVKLVREEIAGGVVKKYYRKAAMNFTFNVSDPANAAVAAEVGMGDAFMEKLVKSLSHFGYDVLPGKTEDAKRALMAMDARSKEILAEIQRSEFEKIEIDRLLVANTYQVATTLRLAEDEQFAGAVKNFTDLFRRRS
jgi:DNA-binding transcriptional regulator GbsR (MarR family)